jgi:hypothetical protein
MDCTGVAGLLVEYHLGAVSDAEADAIDAHLVACSACLRTFLAIKRASDRAESERPRPEVRARLRAEVVRAFPPPGSMKVAVFARRIPLYQGVALAALAASIALVLPNVVQRLSREGDNRAGATAIDTSRTRAESLHIY